MSNDTVLANLVGKTFDFHGAWGDRFKLDNAIYEAVRDPGDGLRSYLKTIQHTPVVKIGDAVGFFRTPIARVTVVSATERLSWDPRRKPGRFAGYSLVDVDDGHVWLYVGTSRADELYPCYIFEYRAAPSMREILALDDPDARESAVVSFMRERKLLH